MNEYLYQFELNVHVFRFLSTGFSPFSQLLAHVGRVFEQSRAASLPTRLIIDVRDNTIPVDMYEVLSQVRQLEKQHPQRTPVVMAVIVPDTPVLKMIRVLVTLTKGQRDDFRIFMGDDADQALRWVSET